MVPKTTTVIEGLPIIWRDASTGDVYEQARCRVFNTKVPERYPTAIIRPTTVAHIQTGIKLAQELGCRVAIRSGGHSWACWSVRDKTVLLDLVDFAHKHYDPVTDTLEASPGTTSLKGSTFLREHGRFVPFGHCGEVGLGGFLLQGGMGLNCRGYGWACEYVKAIDVVTADGALRHCDDKQNADLFWAARGCGPGFPGIVTRFYLNTRPFAPVCKKHVFIWPISEYDSVMRWMVDICAHIDGDVEPIAVSAEDSRFQQRVFTFQATAYGFTDEEVMGKLKTLKETRPPDALQCTEDADTTLEEEYVVAEAANPSQRRYIADDVYISPTVDMVEVCRKSFTTLPKNAWAFYEPLLPRPLSNMSLSMQSNHYIGLYSATQDPSEDALYKSVIAERTLELEKSAVGAYLGDADFQVRPTKFWSEEAFARLRAVRKKWDPSGLFCGYLTEGDKSGVEGLDNALRAYNIAGKQNI